MLSKAQLLSLTGVRFFLALWVVIFHQAFPGYYLGDTLRHLPEPLFCLVRTGYLAVGVFFVLSGFVLAYNYPLLRSWTGQQLTRFAIARFARIYPAYAVGMILTLPLLKHTIVTDAPAVSGLLSTALLQSWAPRFAMAWNAPGWSLSNEAFFYATFPFVGVWIWRLQANRMLWAGLGLWAAALIAPLLALYIPNFGATPATSELASAGTIANLIKFNPILHLPAFAIGVVACRLYHQLDAMRGRGYLLYLPAIAVEFAAISFGNVIPYPLMHNGLLLPLHATIIVGFALGGGIVDRALSIKPLVFLGNASYAMYILHYPIAIWMDTLARRLFGITALEGIKATALYCTLVILASALVLRYVEEPLNLWLKGRLNAMFTAPTPKTMAVAT